MPHHFPIHAQERPAGEQHYRFFTGLFLLKLVAVSCHRVARSSCRKDRAAARMSDPNVKIGTIRRRVSPALDGNPLDERFVAGALSTVCELSWSST